MKLCAAAWLADDFDFWAFDRLLDDLVARREPLVVEPAIALQVEIRAQRVRPRRNAESSDAWFGRALAAHRALHDTARPLVLADLDHALDTWQWTLRLDEAAPARVQLAALLHDLERDQARALLERAECPREIAEPACAIIASHERSDGDRDVNAVNDADALSFFSFDSPGYLAHFGLARTEMKVEYTLARMSRAATTWLPALRLPRPVRHLVEEHAAITSAT